MFKLSGTLIWRLGSRASARKFSTPRPSAFKAEKLNDNKNILEKNENNVEAKDNPGMTHNLHHYQFVTINILFL